MKIQIEGENLGEIKEKLVELAKVFNLDLVEKTVDVVGASVAAVEAGAAMAKKPGRPKKEKSQDAPEEKVSQVAPEVEAKSAPVSKMDAASALQSVIDKKDMLAAREILKKFGASRMSDIREDAYGDLVKACHEAIAS